MLQLAPIAKINFIIRYSTHLYYHTTTMDDNANKMKAERLIPAMMLTLTHKQHEGEFPYHFNMDDKRVKHGFLLVVCSAFPILLMGLS
jgi:hypothetical protein